MQRYRIHLPLFLIASLVLCATPQLADAGAVCVTTRIVQRGGGGGGGGSSSSYNPASSAASNEVRASQREIARVLSDLRRQFDESPEVKDARTIVLQAAAGYQSATGTALESVCSTAAYKQASADVEQAQRRLDAARRDSEHDATVSPARLDLLARSLLQARANLSRIQSTTLAADASVASARDTWMDANGKLLGLQRDFNRSIQSNPQFQAARARLENARRSLSGISR